VNPTRQRRIWTVLLVLLGAAVATALALAALNQNIQHFFSPSDIAQGKAPADRTFRLGGLVEEGSIARVDGGLTVRFVVTDRFRLQPAEFTGILPDLFREGQSVVAVGRLRDGIFVADEVLAKHDETYMPAEVADAITRAKVKQAMQAPDEAGATSPPTPSSGESRSY
jgi:cytochrome c-type biogenesis protein CcmE